MNDFKLKMAEHIKAIKGEPSQLDEALKLQTQLKNQAKEIERLKAEAEKTKIQYVDYEPLSPNATRTERVEYYTKRIRRVQNGWQGETKPKTIVQKRIDMHKAGLFK